MICFHCGKVLASIGVERDYHGTTVRIHKYCIKAYDRDQPVTARAATNTDGRTFVDDEVRANNEIGAFRTVYRRAGETE